jgi:hypothetical protein
LGRNRPPVILRVSDVPATPVCSSLLLHADPNSTFSTLHWEAPRPLQTIVEGRTASQRRPNAFPTCPHSPNFTGPQAWIEGLTHSTLSKLKNRKGKERCESRV